MFPEVFISEYPVWTWLIPNSENDMLNEFYVQLVENAISIPDESTAKLCKAVKLAAVNVVIGISGRNSENSNASLYNGLLFINDKELIIGKHHKLIPTAGERLIWAQGSGDTLQSYNTSAGKIAGLICW